MVTYLPRYVDVSLARALEQFSIVLLDGPRAVGKTTTANQVAASAISLPEDVSLLSFDPASTLSTREAPVLIDEWQLAGTDLLWTLKRIVDETPDPGRFILTGSAEPATYGPTYPLTGRAARLVMEPMTSTERNAHGDKPTFLDGLKSGTPRKPPTAPTEPFSLAKLFISGFPAARSLPDPTMFLQSYANLVAERAGEEGRDASRLNKTLAVLGVLTGQAVPDQRIWQSADINKASWKAYEDLLNRVYLTTALPAFSSNRLKRLTTYPKRFVTDTALALTLAGVTLSDLQRDTALAGRFVESWVVQQLRPQVQLLGGKMMHLRTAAGEREIDLIVEVGNATYAFEVKAGVRPNQADIKHLLWLHQELGESLTLSCVFHGGDELYQLAEHTWAVPLSHL